MNGKPAEKVLFFLIENLPTLMTIGFSAYVVLYSETIQMSTEDLSRWALSLLGLLAVSILIERLGKIRRIENLTQETRDYLLKREGKPSLDLVIEDRTSQAPLETRLQSAKEIVITGGSLIRLTSEYLGYFEQKARDGCRLRFLLVDPESEAAKLLAKNVVYEIDDYEIYSRQIATSLSNLSRLQVRYSEQIEIRLYDHVPPFSLLITDPDKAHGSISVELYTYAVPTRERPKFTLRAFREPRWYNFFLKQYEQMWAKARIWDSGKDSAIADQT